MAERSPYQEKVIQRYYRHFDEIQRQRLSELVTELYLAEGAKKLRLWKRVGENLTKLEFPQQRIDHLLESKNVALLPGVIQELERTV